MTGWLYLNPKFYFHCYRTAPATNSERSAKLVLNVKKVKSNSMRSNACVYDNKGFFKIAGFVREPIEHCSLPWLGK